MLPDMCNPLTAFCILINKTSKPLTLSTIPFYCECGYICIHVYIRNLLKTHIVVLTVAINHIHESSRSTGNWPIPTISYSAIQISCIKLRKVQSQLEHILKDTYSLLITYIYVVIIIQIPVSTITQY